MTFHVGKKINSFILSVYVFSSASVAIFFTRLIKKLPNKKIASAKMMDE